MGNNDNRRSIEARILFDESPIASGVLRDVSTVPLPVPMPSHGDIIQTITSRDCASLPESTMNLCDEILLLCEQSLMKPVLIYADFSIRSVKQDEGVLLQGGCGLSCPGRLFEGASHAIAAIGTIGSDLESQVAIAFQSGDPFYAVVMDAIGSLTLTRMIKAFFNACSAKAAEVDMRIGPRISPGCHRTPLSNQETLFSLLDASRIGVTLSSSYLMSPIKSFSLFLPLGKAIPASLQSSDLCRFCNLKERCHSRYI